MRRRLAVLLLSLPAVSAAAMAAPLTPNHGAVAYSGSLTDSDGRPGSFTVEAQLRAGDFTGRARVVTADYTVEGPLKHGFLENGRCLFRVEQGRSRAELTGKCDSDRIEGRFESFHAGDLKTGTFTGTGKAARAPAAAAVVPLPTAKLTCAYQDRRIGVGLGQTTEYSLAFSKMVSLTLAPAGTYQAGASASGRYVRSGNEIRLQTGPWAGAVGAVERDRSGEPAIVFHIEQNRRPDGVHRIDPYTTRCTRAR
jgi:hypothetical protein